MKYLVIYALLVPFLLIGQSRCNGSLFSNPDNKKRGQFSQSVGKKLAAKWKMDVQGSNSRLDINNKVVELSLYFGIRQKEPVNQETARKIIIDCIDTYLDAINQSQLTIGPMLAFLPFTPKDVQIDISIANEKNGDVYHPALMDVSAYNGYIYYRTEAPEDLYRYKSEIRETYEEAKAILQPKELIKDNSSIVEVESN